MTIGDRARWTAPVAALWASGCGQFFEEPATGVDRNVAAETEVSPCSVSEMTELGSWSSYDLDAVQLWVAADGTLGAGWSLIKQSAAEPWTDTYAAERPPGEPWRSIAPGEPLDGPATADRLDPRRVGYWETDCPANPSTLADHETCRSRWDWVIDPWAVTGIDGSPVVAVWDRGSAQLLWRDPWTRAWQDETRGIDLIFGDGLEDRAVLPGGSFDESVQIVAAAADQSTHLLLEVSRSALVHLAIACPDGA